MFEILYKSCPGIIPKMADIIPQLTSTIVRLIQVCIPVLLVIFGMLDLGKAVMAQKEDEIKAGQKIFFKRLIAAALVFFVFFIMEIVFNMVASGSDKQGTWDCINCFINNDCASA